MHVGTCIFQRRLPREKSALLNLNIAINIVPYTVAISTILAQGSAIKQCRPLVIKAPMPWHKLLLLSLESMRSGWVGRSLAAAFEI